MSRTGSALLWCVRIMAALGIMALTLTREIGMGYLAAAWGFWLFSALMDRFPKQQEKWRRYETPAVLLLILIFIFDFFMRRNSFFIALSHFLLLFQMFKLAGRKMRSDAMQIFAFGFFQILAACTLSVNAWHAVLLLLLIPTATAALFWNYVEKEREQTHEIVSAPVHRAWRRLTLVMCVCAVPINLALTACVFIFFPRLSLNVSMPGFHSGRMGYIDQVNLAQSGALAEDRSTVLWLAFPTVEDQKRWDGYLRGTTLDFFDGRRWSASPSETARSYMADSNGAILLTRPNAGFQPLHQQITLINTSGSTLFAAGLPIQIISPLLFVQRERSGCLHWNSNWRRPLKYQILSDIRAPLPLVENSTGPLFEKFKALPNLPMGRIRALTRGVTRHRSGEAAALAIEDYLRQHMRYSLERDTAGATNPVENFLFVQQRGPCSYFASAMALMLRTEGIPSRVVAGYYKGEWNTHAGQILIREKDAHAWVEAYIAGKGWISYDPTPAEIAPTAEPRVWRYASDYWDYFEFKWDKAVVEYDLYAQIKALESVRDSSEQVNARIARAWGKLSDQLFAPRPLQSGSEVNAGLSIVGHKHLKHGAIILTLFFIAILIRNRSNALREEAVIQRYKRMLKFYSRKGLPRESAETGLEFAQRVVRKWPDQASWVVSVTENYYRVRFASPPKKVS